MKAEVNKDRVGELIEFMVKPEIIDKNFCSKDCPYLSIEIEETDEFYICKFFDESTGSNYLGKHPHRCESCYNIFTIEE